MSKKADVYSARFVDEFIDEEAIDRKSINRSYLRSLKTAICEVSLFRQFLFGVLSRAAFFQDKSDDVFLYAYRTFSSFGKSGCEVLERFIEHYKDTLKRSHLGSHRKV